MTPYDQLTDAALVPLNLARQGDRLRITWPPDANIFHMTLGRHLGPGARNNVAMIFETPQGEVETQTFAEVDRAATGLAATLRGLGYGKGDLIALHTGQHPDTAVAHMAVCKLGGVAVTLSQLYGPETLAHALNDCRARVLLTDAAAWAPLRAGAPTMFPHLRHLFLRAPGTGEHDLAAAFAAPAPALCRNSAAPMMQRC